MVNNSELSNMTSNEKKNTVIKDYNDIAKEYADEFFGTKAYERYIDNFLKVLNGKKILDVGCGNGTDCKYIKDKGYDINGIDISENMLKIAKEKVPNVKFEIMDMTNMEYSNNIYDGIISNCSLFHIPSEEVLLTLKEFNRVLKVDGKILVVVQEGKGEEMVDEPYRHGTKVYMNFFTEEKITNLLVESKFEIISIDKKNCYSQNELGTTELIIIANKI